MSFVRQAHVRLVYGGLDPEHTPSAVSANGIALSALGAVFAGV